MIPHMNMSSESHIDGRRRFKKTFDGTCVTNVQHDAGRGARPNTRTTITHLEYRVREEEYRERDQVLLVCDMQICLQMIQLCAPLSANTQSPSPTRRCTLAFPILVRSKKLSRYRNDSHGTKYQSSLRISFFSSTPLTSTCALYSSPCNAAWSPLSEARSTSDTRPFSFEYVDAAGELLVCAGTAFSGSRSVMSGGGGEGGGWGILESCSLKRGSTLSYLETTRWDRTDEEVVKS